LVRAKAADKIGGLAEEVSARLRGSRIQQLEFEYKGISFAAAFGGGVVLAIEEIDGAAVEVAVIGRSRNFFMRERCRDGHGLVALGNPICWLLVRVAGSLLPLSTVFRTRIGKFVCVLCQRSFQFVFPGLITMDADVFAADSGNGLQQ
jgi:hypothetical protein